MAATLRDDLDRGFTLPSNWYVDDAIFELEKQRIFHRSWQYVGQTAQAAKPGDFFTCQLGDIPIIVVRDAEGVLRAHANVCRHRGSEVVRECSGNRKVLQCQYHGWTYDFSSYFGPYLKARTQGVTYATLWPNIMFAVAADPPSLQVLCARPDDMGHTRQTVDYFFADDVSDEQLRGYVELSDLVTREDVVLCESVQ